MLFDSGFIGFKPDSSKPSHIWLRFASSVMRRFWGILNSTYPNQITYRTLLWLVTSGQKTKIFMSPVSRLTLSKGADPKFLKKNILFLFFTLFNFKIVFRSLLWTRNTFFVKMLCVSPHNSQPYLLWKYLPFYTFIFMFFPLVEIKF